MDKERFDAGGAGVIQFLSVPPPCLRASVVSFMKRNHGGTEITEITRRF
jgi:hypothetical protein